MPMRCLWRCDKLTGRGSAGTVAALAIAAVAIAGLADAGPWAAHAQSPPTTVDVGAIMANATGSDFVDDNRTAVLERAVALFNGMYDDIDLRLAVTELTRSPAVGTDEPRALLEAHGGGSGPRFYIGPTTSEGLVNIRENATTRALLDNDDVLIVTPSSEAPRLAIDDNIFRLAFNVARQGDMLVEEMKSAGIASYIVVARNDAWGQDIAAHIDEKAAQEGLARRGGPIMFELDRSAAHWEGVRDRIAANASAVPAGGGTIGVFFLGYGGDYDDMAAAANASAAIRANTTWFAPSSTGIGAPSPIANDASRDFSTAVGLTALSQDIADNGVKRGIDRHLFPDGGRNATFYEYSTHDSVFVLGNAMRMAMAAGEDAGNVTMVKKYIAAAAMNYTGAALGGSLLLNGDGDLRAPDSFTVHTVNRTTGGWSDGRTVASTVTLVGALLALDSEDYPDNNARDALLAAAADYNEGTDQRPLVKLITYDITNPSNSSRYVALDALTRAHGGGGGPSAYIGPSLSSNVEAVMDYVRGNDILLIGYASESEALSTPDDNLFRMAVSTDRHGRFMAEVMADAGVRSVVTVVRDDSWGRSMSDSIGKALAPNGLQLAGAVTFAPHTTEWGSTLAEVSAAVAGGGGGGATGVAFVGVQSEQESLAPAALGDAVANGTRWFVTPTGFYANTTGIADFARAVNLTAIVLDVEDNPKKAALDARVAGLNFYDYAAYDSLFILGNAIASAVESGRAAGITAVDLGPLVPAQADEYDGILGDIALNSKGDLRSPDRFAVWQVDGTTGMWANTGVTKSTPIVDVGAIVILESDRFDDSARLAAMRIAVEDYNRAAEDGGALYLNLRVVQTSLSPGSATATSPAALDAVMMAAAGEGGTRYYVGPSTSGNSQRVLGYANANGLTLISPSSTAPSLAIEDDALFRLVPNDSQQGKVLADIVHNQQGALLAALIDQTGHEHVVMVVRNDTWGLGLDASTSARLAGVHDVNITRIIHEESDADWSRTAMDIEAEIAGVRTATPSDPIAVLHIGFPGDFVSLAAQASDNSSMRTVPWFGTDGVAGSALILNNDTARQFADAVNLTATKFDVVANERFDRLTAALESRGVAVRTTYEYSAYDSVFVLGRAIEAAISARGDSYGPLDVRSAVRAAAAGYEGALGDIELNRAGDLRTPNSYATWTIDGAIAGDAWTKVDTHPPTPVFDIGALLMLDNNPVYTDDLEKAAMDLAVDDFNTDHELIGDFYINLAVQRINIAPNTGSPDPDALAGLMNMHANGSGPSLYIGPSTSGNSQRVLDYANANDIVLISHSSTAPSLAIQGDNLFRMVAPDNRQGAILADLIGRDGGVTDLVMALRDDTWGRGVDDATKAGLGNGTEITRVVFSEAEANWPGVAASLGTAIDGASASAAAKPQGKAAVLFIGFDGDFNGIASQASSVPSLASVDWFGPDGVGNSQAVISNATSLAFAKNTSLTTVIFTVRSNDVNARLDPAAVYGPSAYDTVRIMGDAIRAAYTGSGAVVPPALDVKARIPSAAAAYTGALGNVTLDANGDLLSPSSYGIYRIGAGDTWELVRVQGVGGGAGASDTQYITIGELFSPQASTIGSINDAVHKAYVLAVEDYNREQAEAGSPLRIQLQRVDLSVTLPNRGANGSAPVSNARPSWDLGGVIAAYANGSGPVAYLGPIATSAVRPLAGLAAESGLVMVSPTIASADLTARDNMFRLSLSDKHEADLITIAAQREGVETILPVLTTSTGQSSYGDEIRIEAEILGMTYLDPVYIPFTFTELNLSPTVAELSATVAGLQSAGTDLSSVGIITEGPHKDFQSLARYAVEYPLLTSVKWFATTGIDPPHPIADSETLRLAQSGLLYSLSWDINQTDRLERVRDTLAQREGYPPNQYSYAAYDAVYLLADAINMSMAPDGTYTGPQVASNMHVAADRLDGLLGSDIRLDENGGRIAPNGAVIWKTTSEGAWEDTTDRAELPPVCSILLERDTIEFGSVSAGGRSDATAVQTITDVGTVPVTGMSLDATEWMNGAGSAVLDKGATAVVIGSGAWTSLAGTVQAAPDGVHTDARFRLDVPSGTPQSSAGPAEQRVVYTASCSMP